MNNPVVRTTKRYLYATILLSLILFLSTGCNAISSPIIAPTPQPTIDPWIAAVQDAQAALANNPDFESSLSSYQDDASQIASYVQYAEQGQTILNYIDQLKNTQIPLVGNAWDILLNLLEDNAPGTSESLTKIEEGLRKALAFNENIQSMTDMQAVIAASQAFRSQPSVENLKILDALLNEPSTSLSGLSENVASLNSMMADVAASLDNLRASLDQASAEAQFPLVGEAIQTLRSLFDGVTLPVDDLEAYTLDLQSRVKADLAVMSAIQAAVDGAQGAGAQGA